MRAGGSSSWTVLLVLGLLAIVALLAISWFTPAVHQVAEGLAKAWTPDLGRVGIVLAGLAAPFVFVAKKVGEWFAGAFGFGPTAREKDIQERTAALEAELKKLREEVRAIDAGRREALERHHAELADVEQRVAPLKQEYAELDARLKARKDGPAPTLAEIEQWLEQQPGYRDAP